MTQLFPFSQFNEAIPKFSGEPNILFIFIGKCNALHDTFTPENKIIFLKVLSVKLFGTALRLYLIRPWRHWHEFRRGLLRHFDIKYFIHFDHDISNLKQNRVDVFHYAIEVKNMIKELNLGCEFICNFKQKIEARKQNNALGLKIFLDGLNDEYKTLINDLEFTKLNDAIAQALIIESKINTKIKPEKSENHDVSDENSSTDN